VTSRKVHWQLLLCSTKIVLIVSTGVSSIIATTAHIIGLYGAHDFASVRLSVPSCNRSSDVQRVCG